MADNANTQQAGPLLEIDLRGPWFTCKQAAAYIPCKTVKAFYEWRKRHGLIARANGTVAKADIDRILRRRKPRRLMHPRSLANLQRRSRKRSK